MAVAEAGITVQCTTGLSGRTKQPSPSNYTTLSLAHILILKLSPLYALPCSRPSRLEVLVSHTSMVAGSQPASN